LLGAETLKLHRYNDYR